jgi:hypothetical protein
MKSLTLYSFIFLFSLLLFGCNDPKGLIEKDLESRFTKFDVVEIKKDSSNIYKAINSLGALEFMTSSVNSEIVKTLNKIENSTNRNEIYNDYLYVDSLYNALFQSFDNFEKSEYDRPDNCYYVKYLIHKEELKLTKEEYYHLRLMPNGKYDIIHRPYVWNEFLYEKNYDLLIKKALKYSSDIHDLKWKYKKR